MYAWWKGKNRRHVNEKEKRKMYKIPISIAAVKIFQCKYYHFQSYQINKSSSGFRKLIGTLVETGENTMVKYF